MNMRTRLLIAMAAVIAVSLGGQRLSGTPVAAASYANPPNNVQTLQPGNGWYICNYDLGTTSYSSCNSSSNTADNPVTILFTGNATNHKVYNLVSTTHCGGCSNGGYFNYTKNGTFYGVFLDHNPNNSLDYGFSHYDGQTGLKSTPACGVTDYHMRWYGWYYDQNNSAYGYHDFLNDLSSLGSFEFATTHEDRGDVSGCATTYYGWQEDAETEFVTDLFPSSSVTAYSFDVYNLSNALSGTACSGTYGNGYWTTDSSGYGHCMQNDGKASYLQLA